MGVESKLRRIVTNGMLATTVATASILADKSTTIVHAQDLDNDPRPTRDEKWLKRNGPVGNKNLYLQKKRLCQMLITRNGMVESHQIEKMELKLLMLLI